MINNIFLHGYVLPEGNDHNLLCNNQNVIAFLVTLYSNREMVKRIGNTWGPCSAVDSALDFESKGPGFESLQGWCTDNDAW
jgi:hypothetical protein